MRIFLKLCFIGLSIGSILNTLMTLFFTTGMIQLNVILTMILALVLGAVSSIYQVEKLSFLAKVMLHLSVGYITFLIVAYVGKWFPFELKFILTSSIIFFMIFFCIWIVFYFIEKKKIEEINLALMNKNSK